MRFSVLAKRSDRTKIEKRQISPTHNIPTRINERYDIAILFHSKATADDVPPEGRVTKFEGSTSGKNMHGELSK